MTAVLVLLGILALLWLLTWVRIGAGVRYVQEGLFVEARFGAIRLTVFPRPKKKKAPPKKKKAKPAEQPKQEKQPEKGGTASLVLEALPYVAEACGDLKRRIRIDRIFVTYTAASCSDAAAAAIQYGRAMAVTGWMTALLENNFHVKERKFDVGVDFDAAHPTIYLDAALSLTIGQALQLALKYGKTALTLMKKKQKQPSTIGKEV